MKTYEKAPVAVHNMMNALITAHHERLTTADVSIEILFARGGLRHHGTAVLGIARIVSIRDRVKGCRDAEITLDADHWEDTETDDDDRRAILDHELSHFLVRWLPPEKGREKEPPMPVLDRAGRPKLHMRHHDWEMGGFDDIAARHGKASVEVKWAEKFAESETGQIVWRMAGESKVAVGGGSVSRATKVEAKRRLGVVDGGEE